MSFCRRIAIIGGLGPHAGAYALQRLLEEASLQYSVFEDYEYPEVILHSVPFKGSDSNGISDGAQVSEQQQESLRQLVACGVDLALFACNSSHVFLPELQEGTSLEIVSLLTAASQKIKGHSAKRFGIMASQSTRDAKLYEQILQTHGRNVINPSNGFQEQVNALIAEAMKAKISDTCLKQFKSLLTQLREQGAEAVIIGCTEISRLTHQVQLPLPVIDSLEAATEILLTKSWQPNL